MTPQRIKDVARINGSVLAEDTAPDFRFHYIDIGSVDKLGHVTIPDEDISFGSAPSRARRLAPAGAVIVSTVRTYLRSIGAVPESTRPLVFSTGFAVLEAGSCIDSRFLAYYCRSQQFVDEVVARSVGVSYPAINAIEIGNLPIDFPTTEEQRRIADFLDAETARLEVLLSRRLRQKELAAEWGAAKVSELLVPGILKYPLGLAPYPWLPSLDGVPMVKIGYVSRLSPGISPSSLPRSGEREVLRPFLQISNVQAGRLKLNTISDVSVPASLVKRTALRHGDVLTTRVGDPDKLGRAAVWESQIDDCLFESNIFAIRPDGERIDSDYLAMMTRTVHGRCYFESTGFRTTGLASTNTGKVLGFPIPLPAVATQRRMVSRVRSVESAVEALSARIDRQVSVIAERRTALITAAVTGQIDVSTASGRGVEE